MEESAGSEIENIKLQEKHEEAKLKEKRELDSKIATLKKSIRNTLTDIENAEKIEEQWKDKYKELLCEVELLKIKRDTLLSQIEDLELELEELIKITDEAVSNVWQMQSSMINAIHEVTDNYDIFALLAKPLPVTYDNKSSIEIDDNIEKELNEAKKRKTIALAERERLSNEPETGVDFIRIKNDLKLYLAKIARLHENKHM